MKEMTRAEKEALSQRICNFYHDAANNSVKTTVNYFKKQNVPQRTIYNIVKGYLTYNTMKDRLCSGRVVKLCVKNLTAIVESVNNKYGVSQRKIGKRFNVHQSIILRNLRERT
jgi:hypothetical protein